MHNACRLSRRWHQHFCRSPSFAGHQQCLQRLQPIREYRQATRTRATKPVYLNSDRDDRKSIGAYSLPPKSDIVVREYEADASDRSKLNRIEPNQEIADEMADARMELMQLDQELAAMKQGPFGPQSEFMQSLPKDAREQLLQALADEGILQGEQEDMLTMAELEQIAEEDEEERTSAPTRLGVTLKIPKKDQAYIRHFNQALQTADKGSDYSVQQSLNLWKWYLRCQQQVRNFSTMVSADVWRLLWDSQTALKVRPKHLIMLSEDMLEAGRNLTVDQWLAYIDSLYRNNNFTTAIDVWTNQRPLLRTNSQASDAYWQLGVRIYASAGQPWKAQELAFNALSQDKADPGILVPVIVAWVQAQDPKALVKAWACYLKLKEKAGSSMLPEIYDRVSNAFLDADHGDMALSVFKDMLIMKETSAHDSREVYKQATQHFEETLQSATAEDQINRIGLSALLILPRQFHNRFFFTSWIKKLIGEKRVDSASMVVELMYERGIAPDAKPLNGIIGAWLREGSVNAQQKAEAMAWSMIEARAEFVSQRKTTSETEGKRYRTIVVDDKNQSVQRRIPSATIETFSILLQHYTRRKNSAEAERLTNTMIHSCEIQPNSYIMNHWLFGDLRAGRIQIVWDKYCNLKRDISPDLETYAALWDTAKVHFSKADPGHAKNFPPAREVYAEMKDWSTKLLPSKMSRARDEFSAELYEQVIRTFCLSTDLPGTLLAMHDMARTFGWYPTENCVRLLCGQAARLLPPEDSTSLRGPRARRSMARSRSAISRVADIVDTIEARRKIALVDQGADAEIVEDPGTDVAQQLRLAVLTEFICLFMQRSQTKTSSYLNDVKIAAKAMHIDTEGIDLSLDESV